MNFIDLFCGTGAFSFVLEKYGHKCVFANDMVKESKEIYELNSDGGVFDLSNLNNLDVEKIPPHSILCAGFPCQPFSVAGKREGFNDERSNVFWKILEILEKKKPEIIILENVKNLKSHDKGKTFKKITEKLEEAGYNIKSCVLNTKDITRLPQNRERIYIVGFLNKPNNFNFEFEEVENTSISSLLETDVPDKYYYTEKLKVYNEVESKVVKTIDTNTIYQYRRYYVRENKSNCCPTLTANMGTGGHNVPLVRDNKGVRKLTPRECFNLQGFPANYLLPDISDSKLYKLAGNAVSIDVIELLINEINRLYPH